MNTDRIKTISNVCMIISIVYSLSVFVLFPSIARRYSEAYIDMGATLPVMSVFFVNGTYLWFVIPAFVLTIGKELFVKDDINRMLLNIAYVSCLFILSMFFIVAFFLPIVSPVC